ncbi:type III secretion protein Q [Neorhizobium huautlense]|uniref:Type III secretion protein Q n=1 Tax=Neorhizobium huautlense TaxID=67774 RepID=A0ABT9PRX0_9HYPH|nr:FliM/FliN family flagellar motor switch protein [Neorhizobium huautlense]MDP9837212.1 type III secretion protein Q [Neorhizobium huautlense]
MLRDTGAHFGLGCGGASVAEILVTQPAPAPVSLAERLSRPRRPIAGMLAGRKIGLHPAVGRVDDKLVAMSFRIGAETCRLHASAGLVDWLAQPLGLEGALIDEEPLQRAVLLELAGLDFIRQIEAHIGDDIRLGEGDAGPTLHAQEMSIEADGTMLPLRLELTERLVEKLADYLDRLQPPEPADLSGAAVELVIEAGSQDLSIAELESLSPSDVVMLTHHRPVVVANDRLVAAVRRKADGVELDGAFYPLTRRAMVGSLADIQSGRETRHMVHMVSETGRVTTTIGAIDALKPGEALPLSCFDGTGVDLVVDNRRFGRGELIMIGAGLGVRIVSLFPAAPALAPDSRTA